MATKRVAYFDNLKFILITLVVIGHFLVGLGDNDGLTTAIWRWIYLFHMPAFLFVSGLFAKKMYSPEKGLNVNNVAFYLLIFVLLYSLLHLVRTLCGTEPKFDLFEVGSIPWYFLTMATLGASTAIITKIHGGAKVVVPLAVLVALVFPLSQGFGDYLGLGRSCSFAPFFFAGFFLPTERFLSWVKHMKQAKWPPKAAALFLLGVFLFYLFGPEGLCWTLINASTGHSPYAITDDYSTEIEMIIRLVYYALATAAILAVAVLTPTKKTIFTEFGSRTLQVYFLHPFLYFLYRDLGIIDLVIPYVPYATIAIMLLSIGLTFLLAWPKWPEQAFRTLQRSINIDNNP